jgi:hypothetical protein
MGGRRDNRRFDYAIKRAHGRPVKRPRSLRCLRCGEKIAVKVKGPLPIYCSHSCRQLAYLRDKLNRPHLARLQNDLSAAARIAETRRVVWDLLKEAGVVTTPDPPPSPERKRPSLQVVKLDE